MTEILEIGTLVAKTGMVVYGSYLVHNLLGRIVKFLENRNLIPPKD